MKTTLSLLTMEADRKVRFREERPCLTRLARSINASWANDYRPALSPVHRTVGIMPVRFSIHVYREALALPASQKMD
ncbi:hypothetical protein [Paraburkholderia fungorum]|uniref:hypothetical protein n=1 Tax=Paraburkholderia fungorum TaxID=134537 RepID=UPI00048019F3|nr:hypothetical protein [Paraburkholderia fungorum]PZR48476.1 MAG: hypothetical protein DI523_10735 [Paraburkholderia fungorum]